MKCENPCGPGAVGSDPGAGTAFAISKRLRQVQEGVAVAVTTYHIQNVLRNYHRRLRTGRLEEPAREKGGSEGMGRMARGTRQEIERQVAWQIRRRLIRRTFQDGRGGP
jgi:hypothetical protein